MHGPFSTLCVYLCLQCPLEKRCVCEKGERGPSGPAVSKYTLVFDPSGCGLVGWLRLHSLISFVIAFIVTRHLFNTFLTKIPETLVEMFTFV